MPTYATTFQNNSSDCYSAMHEIVLSMKLYTHGKYTWKVSELVLDIPLLNMCEGH